MGGIIHGIDQMWGLGQLKRNSVKSWQKLGQQQLNKKASPPSTREKKNLIHKNLILTALFSLREHMNENLLLITIGKKPHHFALKMQCTPLTSICSDVNISQHPPVKLHLFISFHSLSRFYS